MLPWLAAGVAGVVLAALIVVYFVVQGSNSSSGVAGQLTSEEQAAVAAAGPEAANMITFSRANFESDYQRALAGLTGPIKSDLANDKATTLSQLTKNKVDISATVRYSALVGKVANKKVPTYVVLVVLFAYQSTNKNVPNPLNLQITVEKIGGKWLLSDNTQVTVS